MTHGKQSTDADAQSGSSGALVAVERARVLSMARFRLVLTTFVAVLLLGVSALSVGLVSRISEQSTPDTARDLEGKARRGAAELARAAEIGARDLAQVRKALTYYADDEDIAAIVVTDPAGKVLLQHGEPAQMPQAFSGSPNGISNQAGLFVSWAEVELEGEPAGKVAVFVSQSRLRAAEELKNRAIQVGLGGGTLAFVGFLLFVKFYIGPRVQMTQRVVSSSATETARALEATRLKSADAPVSSQRIAESVVGPQAPPRAPFEPGFKRSQAVSKLFLSLSPGQVAAVRAAVATADAEGQKAHAHKLKGSCYAIGARTMAELCARIEAGEADAPALVEELQGELEIVVAALEASLTRAEPAAAQRSTSV